MKFQLVRTIFKILQFRSAQRKRNPILLSSSSFHHRNRKRVKRIRNAKEEFQNLRWKYYLKFPQFLQEGTKPHLNARP